ncbi:hypothetical protein Dimus_014210 [Dionaea muscipula]
MKMMAWLLHIFFLHFLALTFTAAGQEPGVHFLSLNDPNVKDQPQPSPRDHLHLHLQVAVSVSPDELYEVSNSVLMAETWLRANVLAYYPSSKITHIVVGHNVLCFDEKFALVLPCLKNIYYSLTRWGLEGEIKVSPSLSSHCLEQPHSGADLDEKLMKPLLEFIQSTNSTYFVNPLESSDEIGTTHFESMRKFRSNWNFNDEGGPKGVKIKFKSTSRKLSFVDSKAIDRYPARPTPLPQLSPLPPISVPFAPQPSQAVTVAPAMPPLGYQLPPCYPPSVPPPPEAVPVAHENLWCVAKPSVPPEKLQEALDYACGDGGADCEEIQPLGSCFYPDTVVAHASFAFNSYWQKNKRYGGNCIFDGTAMVINADPSFQNCRFIVI